jgi:hypothetical protein
MLYFPYTPLLVLEPFKASEPGYVDGDIPYPPYGDCHTDPRELVRTIAILGCRAAVLLMIMLMTGALSACSVADLLQRSTPTPPPTRTPAPTFTPDGDSISVITPTPSISGTPGVIVIPPGVDPRTLIPIPPTATATTEPTVI